MKKALILWLIFCITGLMGCSAFTSPATYINKHKSEVKLKAEVASQIDPDFAEQCRDLMSLALYYSDVSTTSKSYELKRISSLMYDKVHWMEGAKKTSEIQANMLSQMSGIMGFSSMHYRRMAEIEKLNRSVVSISDEKNKKNEEQMKNMVDEMNKLIGITMDMYFEKN